MNRTFEKLRDTKEKNELEGINLDCSNMDKKSRTRVLRSRKNQSKKHFIYGIIIVFCLALVLIGSNIQTKQDEASEVTQSSNPIPQHTTSHTKTTRSDYPLAQDFTLVDINGEKFTLNDFRGKIVILDYMGATCKPCKEQIIELKSIHNSYSERLEILSISVHGGKGMNEQLQSFADFYNVKWRIAIDIAGTSFEYQIKFIPTTIIIDDEGYIRFRHEGIVRAQTLTQEIETILGDV
ncbi:TlpA family protein disulfide reductase [Thermoproteota archaeon]